MIHIPSYCAHLPSFGIHHLESSDQNNRYTRRSGPKLMHTNSYRNTMFCCSPAFPRKLEGKGVNNAPILGSRSAYLPLYPKAWERRPNSSFERRSSYIVAKQPSLSRCVSQYLNFGVHPAVSRSGPTPMANELCF